jgi:hypothetical protein
MYTERITFLMFLHLNCLQYSISTMPKARKNTEIVQVSVTMDRQLKSEYSKLAVKMDLSFSQLVRYALRRVAEGINDYESIEKRNRNQMHGQNMSN